MKRRVKKAILITLSVTQVFLLGGCGNGKKKETKNQVTLVIDWSPNADHAGIYAAKEMGYFKDEGLDVKIERPIEEGAEKEVDRNKAQFGISYQDTLTDYITGDQSLKIKSVAALVQYSTAGILSRKGEGMDRPKGLEGKKYATWNWKIEKAMIEDVMTSNAGNYKKMIQIPNAVTDEVKALQNKETDALFVYYQNAGVLAKKEGLETDFFRFADYNEKLAYYAPVLIANSDYLKSNGEQAKKVLKAIQKGYEYAIEHPEESAKILCKEDSNLEQDKVKEQISYLADGKYIEKGKKWGEIDKDRWNGFYQWVNEKKLADSEIPKDAALDLSYLPSES